MDSESLQRWRLHPGTYSRCTKPETASRGKTLFQHGFESVVGGISDSVFREDTGEYGDAVHWATSTSVGVTVGRGVGTESHQGESSGRDRADRSAGRDHSGALGAVRKVESSGRNHVARRNAERRVLARGRARCGVLRRAERRIDVQASLRRRWINIAPDEQVVPLGAYVAYL